MSKGNMLLGQARGKVGDLVFSRSGGKQIVRSRAAQVKNPQTEKQMIQRIILATVAQAYSRFSEICDHSFEGVPAGQRSASYFNRVNMDRLRQAIAREVASGGDLSSVYAFTPISSQVYAANEFLIARGSLPSVEVGFTGSTAATLSLSSNTYQDVLDAYGLQRGDQLTFVSTQGTTGENTQFVYARVILDPTNADGSAADLSVPFVVNGSVNLPNPRNEGVFSTLSFADGVLSYAFSAQPISGAAVIVSRQKTDGSWLRSTAVLAVNDVAIAGFMQSMQDCLDLFASGSIDTLSDLYLNNAGRGRLASSDVSASVSIPALSLNNVQVVEGVTITSPVSSVLGYVSSHPWGSNSSVLYLGVAPVGQDVNESTSGYIRITSVRENGLLASPSNPVNIPAGQYRVWLDNYDAEQAAASDIVITFTE